jgi:hypothetical protein
MGSTRDDVKVAVIRWSGIVLDPGDIIEIRRIFRKVPGQKSTVRSTWHSTSDLPDVVEDLIRDNELGFNIYAGANPRPWVGATTDANIRLARTVFADFDRCANVEIVRKRIWAFGLPPASLLLDSGHGVHAYWRLYFAIRDLLLWEEFQKDLIHALDSDPVIHNPERIMRLPGFFNYKPPVTVSTLIEGEWGRIYDFESLRKVVPPRPKPVPSRRIPSGVSQRPHDHDRQGDGEYWLDKALRRVSPGDKRKHGRNWTGLWLAQQLRDSGISESQAQRYMLRYAELVPNGGSDTYDDNEALKSLRNAFSQRRRDPARSQGRTPDLRLVGSTVA